MRTPALAALATLLLVSVACGGKPDSASTARTEAALASPAPDAAYTVRGEIARLPAEPGGEVSIRHESIPEFRDREGKVVGMMAMVMPFDVEPDGTLAGLAAGDRVEFRLELRWNAAASPARVGAFRRLPPGTRLEFDEDQPAADAGATPR